MLNVTGQDFVSSLPLPTAPDMYDVSGRAQQGSTGIVGEEIQLSGGTLYSPLITRTSYAGYFIIPNVPPGTYTVSIVSSRYVYNNPTQTITIVSGMVGGLFVGFTVLSAILPPGPEPYVLSGRITTTTGAPLNNVAVQLITDDGTAQVAVSQSDGSYRLVGVPTGLYVLQYSRVGSALTPSWQVVGVSDGDNSVGTDVVVSVSALNITGTISGINVASAVITYSGPTSGSVQPDSSGLFTISPTRPGIYVIRPQLAGHYFTPQFRPVAGIGSAANQNFTSTAGDAPAPPTYAMRASISGAVLQGVTINITDISGTPITSGVTNAAGWVDLAVSNNMYFVRASLSGYIFTPTVRGVAINGSAGYQYFVATAI